VVGSRVCSRTVSALCGGTETGTEAPVNVMKTTLSNKNSGSQPCLTSSAEMWSFFEALIHDYELGSSYVYVKLFSLTLCCIGVKIFVSLLCDENINLAHNKRLLWHHRGLCTLSS